jgi:hypothetical protein
VIRARRALLAIVVASAMIVACRGVIGIEDLTLVDGGGADGSKDAPVDAPPDRPADTGPKDPCASGGNPCPPCCHQSHKAELAELIRLARQSGCMCGGGGCGSECGNSDCSPTVPPPMMVDGTCAMCEDSLFRGNPTGACAKTITDCENSAACQPAIHCLQSCQ